MKSSYKRIATQLRHKFADYTGVVYKVGVWDAVGMSGYGIHVYWDMHPTGRNDGLMLHVDSKAEAEAILAEINRQERQECHE